MYPEPKHSPSRPIASLFITGGMLLALAGIVYTWNAIGTAPSPGVGAAWAFASFTPPDADTQSAPSSTDEDEEGIQECIITLLSGRKITGELVRQDSLIVVIGINGIDTTFQKKNVAEVKILPPVRERYTQMRGAIADTDIDARLSLVEWLRARKAYTLALKELESILIVDPNNPRAKLLHTWLSEHSKLKRADLGQAQDRVDPKAESRTQEDKRDYKIKRNEFPTLTPEQINLMRVYEIDLRDPPKIRVPDEVIEELMARSPEEFSPNKDERDKIFALPEIDKLKLMFKLKARDLYPKVQVLGTPNSLKRFKDQVHNGRGWLINACASTRCHGGVDAGSFRLLNTKPNSDETAFSNLYIIEHTTLSDGTPLIDFKSPDRSPLLQLGMIRSNALTPHPEIPSDYPGMGYRPIFRTTRDRKYQQAIDWIRSMYQPRPKYGFDYPPTPPNPDQTPPPEAP